MLPLYHDPHFTFRFADDRIIPRFHLEGVEAGRRVAVFRIDPATGVRLGLPEPLVVRAGGFVRLSLVAECGVRVVGHILFSDLPVGTAAGTVSVLA